jgi:hypothetical protein
MKHFSFSGGVRATTWIGIGLGWILGRAGLSHGTLTVAEGFENRGTIELTREGGSWSAALSVTSGTLINEGTIRVLEGAAGNRVLRVELDHRATFEVRRTVSLFITPRTLPAEVFRLREQTQWTKRFRDLNEITIGTGNNPSTLGDHENDDSN